MRSFLVRRGRQYALITRQQHTQAADSLDRAGRQTSRLPLLLFSKRQNGSTESTLRVTPFQDRIHRVVGYADSHIALRDACKCSKCVDPSTRQREFDFADIPLDIHGEVKEVDGTWHVKWTNDLPGFEDHISVFTPEQLERLKGPPKLSSTRLWDKETFEEETESVNFNVFMEKGSGLAKVLHLLGRHGLVLVKNVPRDENMIVALGERLAPLRNTFYGKTWDVKSVPDSKNVAYTHKHLGFHMDLMYLKEPPNIQLLHCLDNSCTGGESRFVDTFKAWDILISEDRDLATSLRAASIRYEYDNDGHYYTDVKPIIQSATPMEGPRRPVQGHRNKALDKISRVYWSPPFVGSIWSEPGERPDLVRNKVEASKAFAKILERPELIYEEKMEPGTCMIFDNLRILHARNAFDNNSGHRWLRGCYLDGQDVLSKEMAMNGMISHMEIKKNKKFPINQKRLKLDGNVF